MPEEPIDISRIEAGYTPDTAFVRRSSSDLSDVGEEAMKMMDVVAQETRLKILELLKKNGELSVEVLCTHLKQSQPGVSHHLALMRKTGILQDRRDGRHNYYSIAPSAIRRMRPIIDRLQDIFSIREMKVIDSVDIKNRQRPEVGFMKDEGSDLSDVGEETMKMMDVVAQETRLKILELLREHGELSVGFLQTHLSLSQSNVSFHLGLMRTAGVVQRHRAGKFMYYLIAPSAIKRMKPIIDRLRHIFSQL